MTALFGKGFRNGALSAALLMLLSARADAAAMTWDLSNVFFSDGTQATGSLTFFDDGSLALSTWDVTVAPNNVLTITQFTFDPADSEYAFTVAANLSYPLIELATGGLDNALIFVLPEYALPATGTVDLATTTLPFVDSRGTPISSFQEETVNAMFPAVVRYVVSGSLVSESTAAPEPSTCILAGGALLTLVAWKRKRRAESF